jgi:hypothetical protein
MIRNVPICERYDIKLIIETTIQNTMTKFNTIKRMRLARLETGLIGIFRLDCSSSGIS